MGEVTHEQVTMSKLYDMPVPRASHGAEARSWFAGNSPGVFRGDVEGAPMGSNKNVFPRMVISYRELGGEYRSTAGPIFYTFFPKIAASSGCVGSRVKPIIEGIAPNRTAIAEARRKSFEAWRSKNAPDSRRAK